MKKFLLLGMSLLLLCTGCGVKKAAVPMPVRLKSLQAGPELILHFISAPHTDATLAMQNGKTMLIHSSSNNDMSLLCDYLHALGIKTPDYVVYSHGLSAPPALRGKTVYAPNFAPEAGEIQKITAGDGFAFEESHVRFSASETAGALDTEIHFLTSVQKIPATVASENAAASVMQIVSDTTGVQSEIRHFKLSEILPDA